MRVTVFNGCKWWGPNPIEGLEPDFGEDVIYIGDNHDFNHMTGNYESAENKINWYKKFLGKCMETHTMVLNGLSEVCVGHGMVNKKFALNHKERVLFLNGSYPLKWKWLRRWADKKSIGTSRVWAKILTWIYKENPSNSLSKKQTTVMLRHAKNFDVHTVVFGYNNPIDTIDEMHDGVRLISVPRGRTDLEINHAH